MDIKLSDDEIIKALEFCLNRELYCDECPLHDKHYPCLCANKLKKESIDLIHRLHGENANLREELNDERFAVDKWMEENAEQKAEIERLTKRCEIAEGTKNRLTIFDRMAIHDKAVKDTAKDILQAVDNESCGQTECITNRIRREYGVEVE